MNCNGGYGNLPPQYVSVPQGIDPDMIMKLVDFLDKRNKSSGSGGSETDRFFHRLDKLEKKAEKKKKEAEEAEKLKKKKDEPVKAPTFNLFQVFLMMSAFGLPFGALQWSLGSIAIKAIKDIVVQ